MEMVSQGVVKNQQQTTKEQESFCDDAGLTDYRGVSYTKHSQKIKRDV
jgi:hypothetical protein